MNATVNSLHIRREYTFNVNAPIGIPFRRLVDNLTIPQLQHLMQNAINALTGQGKYQGNRVSEPNQRQMMERIIYAQGAIDLIRQATTGKIAVLRQYPDYWVAYVLQDGKTVASVDACNKSLAVRWVRDNHRDVVRLVA